MSLQLINRVVAITPCPSKVRTPPHKRRTRNFCRARNFDSSEKALLDKFWRSKGIREVQDRLDLIQIAQEHTGVSSLSQDEILPGVFYVWNKHKLGNEISCISQSVLKLSTVLGGSEEVDVVWMCLQEPKLLTMDRAVLIKRLLEMKLSLSGTQANVLRLVEQQPKLLLECEKTVDRLEEPSEQIPAWEHGLMSDKDEAWDKRYLILKEFCTDHGHSHVGFIETDDVELTQWTSKQRRDFFEGVLDDRRRKRLEALEFEFEEEEAEWLRWWYELKVQLRTSSRLLTLSSQHSFLLLNWCRVQRIARKSGQLTERRVRKLDEIGFDWTAPDPLS